jgi:hypothetical protein
VEARSRAMTERGFRRIVRRRRLPPETQAAFDAFRGVLGSVERGKGALTESVPSTRFAGRPLPDTLSEFEECMRDAQRAMPGWRRPSLEREWRAADGALAEALSRAERIRMEAPDPGGFEGVIGLVGDLLAPLEAFQPAVVAFRKLRS